MKEALIDLDSLSSTTPSFIRESQKVLSDMRQLPYLQHAEGSPLRPSKSTQYIIREQGFHQKKVSGD
jgi:hypothetical protein